MNLSFETWTKLYSVAVSVTWWSKTSWITEWSQWSWPWRDCWYQFEYSKNCWAHGIFTHNSLQCLHSVVRETKKHPARTGCAEKEIGGHWTDWFELSTMFSFCFRLHFWLRRTGRTSWSLCLKVRRWWRKTAWRTFGSSWWTFPPLWMPFMTCTPWWMLSWTTRCEGSCPGAFLRSDSIPLEISSTQNSMQLSFLLFVLFIFACVVREFSVLAWIMLEKKTKKQQPEVH